MGKEGKIEKKNLINKEGIQGEVDRIYDLRCIDSFKEYRPGGAYGALRSIHDIIESAKENATELTEQIDKEKIQKIYEKALSDGGEMGSVKWFSEGLNIPIRLTEGIKTVEEESYIRVIHNPNVGHVDAIRERLIIEAKREEGVDLDYDKVVKMEFREFLNIPKEKWLDEEKEVKIDDKPIKIEAHGFFKEDKDEIEGKFIMAKDPETDETRIIFDSTMGEHGDIGAKYDVEPIGGGWMAMNPKEKIIVVKKESRDFGMEPREKTIQTLKESYPDWKIEEEKEEE